MVNEIHDALIKHDKHKAVGVRSKGAPESCLERPFMRIGGREIYRGIFMKASILLHSFASYHPYMGGNKRTALTVTYWFLHVNGYDFIFPSDTFEFMRSIADDKIKYIYINSIVKWIRKACIKNMFYDMNEDVVIALFNNKRVSLRGGKYILGYTTDIRQ